MLANLKILKTIIRNIAKLLKIRLKIYIITRARKTAEIAIKQIIAQQFQAEKKDQKLETNYSIKGWI